MVFNSSFINNKEILFYIYIILIIFMIILSIYWVLKELHENK